MGNRVLNAVSDGLTLMLSGKLLHMEGDALEKARSPYVANVVTDCSNKFLSEDLSMRDGLWKVISLL